jgi:poly(ADP-ribose) glycohydrolase ARH3
MLPRFLGCLLGHAVGDAVGAPFERCPAEAIYRDFGPARRIVDAPRIEELIYTDDTQMMVAVAEALIEDGEIDVDRLAMRFANAYEPQRGYGPGARRILEAARAGDDWKELARTIFPGGSLGNGAAVRVAPIALRISSQMMSSVFSAIRWRRMNRCPARWRASPHIRSTGRGRKCRLLSMFPKLR